MDRISSLDAALAVGGQIAAGELVSSAVSGGRSPLALVGKALIDATPGPLVDVAVAVLESADKPVLRASLVANWLGAAAVAAPFGDVRRVVLAAGALSGAASLRRPGGPVTAALVTTAAGMLGGTAGLALLQTPNRGRRIAWAALSGAALATARARQGRRYADAMTARAAITLPAPEHPAGPVPEGAELAVKGLTPLFTAPGRFFVTDVTYAPPIVDVKAWTLRVHGMVDRELELSFDDLLEIGLVEVDATLVCVHNPVGGPRVGSARWLGVPVGALLERAGVQRDAEQLVARSVDGFTAGVPIDDLATRQAIIAVGMGGEPLPVAHGYPARLLVPGIWGADANTKWLTEVELTSWAAVCDYWDTRGWPRRPTSVAPGSRIDVPADRSVVAAGPTEIAGVAWAPHRGVTGVEVRVGDGPWHRAELSGELASTMWRQWRLEWTATPGPHELHVRTLSHHQTQHEQQQPPYPVGSRGQHFVSIDVRAAPPTTLSLVTGGAHARWAALEERARLGAAAFPAWRSRGYPPAPRWSPPSAQRTAVDEREA